MNNTSDNDIPLKPENVEFLLPPDIFEELFSEIPKENKNESDSGILVNEGTRNGVTVQAADSAYDPSTHIIPNAEALEKNGEHVLGTQQISWAQIVKGKPNNLNVNLGVTGASFPSLMESFAKLEKREGKAISPNINAQQARGGSKKILPHINGLGERKKNKKGGKKSFGNETMQK